LETSAANIAGHAGNGNYHIIPLMDIAKASERAKIVPVSKQVYDLIIEYGGSITAEHNDGIMRTPFRVFTAFTFCFYII
jgi:FAD/FMN-containing dehydrogenase